MADDPIFPSLDELLRVPEMVGVSNTREAREVAEDGGREQLLFSPEPLETDPSELRSETTEELQGLVRELSEARARAAGEQSDLTREFARGASRRLLTNVAPSLTQALTGQQLNAQQQTEQRRREAQQAGQRALQSEREARQVEETAGIQGDIRATRLEQQAEQRATNRSRENEQLNRQALQQQIGQINQLQQQATDRQFQVGLQKLQNQTQKRLLSAELRAEQQKMGLGGLLGEDETKTLTQFGTQFQNLRNSITNALEGFSSDTETGGVFGIGDVEGGFEQEEQLNRVRAQKENLLKAAEEASEALSQFQTFGFGQAVPQRVKQLERMINVARTIGGAPENAKSTASAVNSVADQAEQAIRGRGFDRREFIQSVLTQAQGQPQSQTQDENQPQSGQPTGNLSNKIDQAFQ